MRPSAASSKKRSIPAGEKMGSTLVGRVPAFGGWWTSRGTTTKERAGAAIVRRPTRTVGYPSGTRKVSSWLRWRWNLDARSYRS
jgi:hypothetical protein